MDDEDDVSSNSKTFFFCKQGYWDSIKLLPFLLFRWLPVSLFSVLFLNTFARHIFIRYWLFSFLSASKCVCSWIFLVFETPVWEDVWQFILLIVVCLTIPFKFQEFTVSVVSPLCFSSSLRILGLYLSACRENNCSFHKITLFTHISTF